MDGDGTEAELLAVAAAWAQAIVANDTARIASFVTEDWVLVSGAGISPARSSSPWSRPGS